MKLDQSTRTSELLNHGITRRELGQILGVSAGGAALAQAMAGAHVTVAQSDDDERPEVIVGVAGLPANLDPPQHISNVGNRIWYSMYDHLIEPDFAGGDPPGTGSDTLPMLASEWERIDDLTLELTLRDDILFHNGEPMTADDVKFSFERMMGEDVPAELANTRVFVSAFDQVEAVDDTTVRIVTTAPDPVIEKRLAAMPFWIVPRAYFEEVGMEAFGQDPIGTGPYQFVELRTDDALVLESFDDYWGGRPPISRLTFRVIPETATRITSVSTGEVQMITNVPPDQVPTLESEDDVNVLEIPLANCHVLIFNTHHEALQDKRIRQALRLGIDRQLLVDTLWSGKAQLMRGHQIEAWGELYNPDRPILEYDPDRARQLVEESDYNGETIIYFAHPTYYTFGAEAAQAIVPMWQDLGINAEVEIREDIFDLEPEEVMVRQWSNGLFPADPDGTFWRNWGEETPPQRDFWTPEDPSFNELGTEARQTLDTDFRYEAYQEMLDIWEEESPGTILYIPIENYAAATGIDWQPYSFWYMDFRADNISFEE